MDRFSSSVVSAGLTTYLESMDFGDNQYSFTSIFGPNPTIIRIDRCEVGSCATEETEYLRQKLSNFCDLYRFHLLYNIIQLQYVGTYTYNTYRLLQDICLDISSLKLETKINGKLNSLIPYLVY